MKKIVLIILACALNITGNAQTAVDINCNANLFWALSSAGNIEEFQLGSTSVTSMGNILTCPGGGSLAVSDNLNTGQTPTFYSSAIYSGLNHPMYYTGTTWDTTAATSIYTMHQAAGLGNDLYYMKGGTGPQALLKYDGSMLTTILVDSSFAFSVADFAIDNTGNIWTFTGPSIASCQFLTVFSPAGTIIKQYNVSFSGAGAYGCFMHNSVIYVAYNSPPSLHPYAIIGDSAVAQPVINMPSTSYRDLASCSPGNPLAIADHIDQSSFSIFPNPVDGQLNIHSEPGEKEFSIYSLNGSCRVYNTNSSGESLVIEMHSFAPGIYIIECRSEKGVWRKKFVKM